MNNDTLKMIDALKTQLASIERQLATQAKAPARDSATVKSELLSTLKQSGHMSVADLITACKLPKSSAWVLIRKMDRDAEIFLQVTRRPEITGRKDGRDVTLAWHPDAIATQ
jgi:hypothetical protein